MGYFKANLLPWILRILNIAIVSAATAGAITFGAVTLNSKELFSLASSYNSDLTLRLFIIAWAANFFPLLVAYLKKSPLPIPR